MTGATGVASDADVELGLELYRTMVLCRSTEAAIEGLHRSARMVGSFHSSMGHEGAAVGICSVLRSDDLVTTTHRGHAHAIAKGVPVEEVLAELFGRATGVCSGKGGSMHLHHPPSGFLGENAIVAGAMPWAAGAAWARRRRGEDVVAVAFFGDGAASQGLFYETLRMAAYFSTPCLFVCENNGLAHSMAVERLFGPTGTIATIAEAAGVRSEVVDGGDVLAVHAAAKRTVDQMRVDGQPAFMECRVVRARAHSLNDPEYRYRDRGEGRDELEKHDPITTLRGLLVDAAGGRLDEIDGAIADQVAKAILSAEAGPRPSPLAALSGVDSISGAASL